MKTIVRICFAVKMENTGSPNSPSDYLGREVVLCYKDSNIIRVCIGTQRFYFKSTKIVYFVNKIVPCSRSIIIKFTTFDCFVKVLISYISPFDFFCVSFDFVNEFLNFTSFCFDLFCECLISIMRVLFLKCVCLISKMRVWFQKWAFDFKNLSVWFQVWTFDF